MGITSLGRFGCSLYAGYEDTNQSTTTVDGLSIVSVFDAEWSHHTLSPAASEADDESVRVWASSEMAWICPRVSFG